MANKRGQGLNIPITATPDQLAKDMDNAVKIVQQAAGLTERAAQKMADGLKDKLDGIAQGGRGSFRSVQNEAKKMLLSMEQAGQGGSKAFDQVLKQTGRLRDDIEDLDALIQVAKPDGPFIAMNNALRVGVGFANAAQGAMALLGAESEETQKVIMKLQAGMALAEGLKGLEGAKDVLVQINYIVRANPFFAVATAVIALGAAVYALNGFLNHTVDQYEALTNVQTKAFEATVKERTELEYYKDRLNDVNITQEERSRLLKEISDKYPDYLGQLDNEGTTQTEINDLITKYINLLDIKAQAQAAQELYVEALKDEAKNQKEALEANIGAIANSGNAFGLVNELSAKYNEQQAENANTDARYYKSLFENLRKQADLQDAVLRKAGGDPTQGDKPKKEDKAHVAVKSMNVELKSQQNIAQQLVRTHEELLHGVTLQGPALTLSAEYWNKLTEANRAYQEQQKKVIITSAELTEVLQTQVAGAIGSVSAAIGTAIVAGDQLGQAIGKAMLSALANFMKQLGEMFIAAGVNKLIFDAAMISIGGGGLAIAAGAALVAASAAATAKIQQSNAPKKFAMGGIVPGNSFYGDTVPIMANSSEMILNRAQQGALFNMIRGGSGSNYNVQVYPIIDSRGISVMVEQGNRQRRRG